MTPLLRKYYVLCLDLRHYVVWGIKINLISTKWFEVFDCDLHLAEWLLLLSLIFLNNYIYLNNYNYDLLKLSHARLVNRNWISSFGGRPYIYITRKRMYIRILSVPLSINLMLLCYDILGDKRLYLILDSCWLRF